MPTEDQYVCPVGSVDHQLSVSCWVSGPQSTSPACPHVPPGGLQGPGSYLADVVVDGVCVSVVDRVAHVVEEAVLVCVHLCQGHAGPGVLSPVGRVGGLGEQTHALGHEGHGNQEGTLKALGTRRGD